MNEALGINLDGHDAGETVETVGLHLYFLEPTTMNCGVTIGEKTQVH